METEADALAALEKAIERAHKVVWLISLAVAVAVAVLVLDYAIKNAIVRQVGEADRLIKLTSEVSYGPAAPPKPKFRGGDIDSSSGPIGRAGMVSDAGMATGSPDGDRPQPGEVPRRTAGPPLSTDSDG